MTNPNTYQKAQKYVNTFSYADTQSFAQATLYAMLDHRPFKIEDVKSYVLEWMKGQEAYLKMQPYIPCVFVQQVSAQRYHVGWRFTRKGTPVGEVQTDCHPALYPDQRIVWVHEEEEEFNQ